MKHLKLIMLFASIVVILASCGKDDSEPEVLVTSVSLNPTTLTLEIDKTSTLTATISPSDATNKTLTWKSSKEDVATIDKTGVVTAKASGETTITVTSHNGKTATCKVTVKEATVAVTGVSLNKTTLLLDKGETETLIATVEPSNATNKTVIWESSDKSIADVDDNGKITALDFGEATITVTTEDGSKTASCLVQITASIFTVYEGANYRSGRYPFYGVYNDSYTRSEVIYPASLLFPIKGKTIKSLKYYIANGSGSRWNTTQKIYMKEVPTSDFNDMSNFYGDQVSTLVFTGELKPSFSEGEFEIVLDTPFEYNGGNLLIGTMNTTKGDYGTREFYGMLFTDNDTSAYGYSQTSLSDMPFDTNGFIPKTTFICQ